MVGIIWQLELGFEGNIQYARTSALKTNALQDIILKCKKIGSDNPASPIVLYSQNLEDYEPLFAVKSYLIHTGMKNPIMLEMAEDFRNGAFTALMAPALLKSLRTLEEGASGFTPLNSMSEHQVCYYVAFTVAPKSTRCIVASVIK